MIVASASSAASCTTPVPPAPGATGAIDGLIINATTGQPLVGANVDILNAAGALVLRVTTDENGEYTADGLPVGCYTVVARQPGFQAGSLPDVCVADDQETNADLELQTEAAGAPGQPGTPTPTVMPGTPTPTATRAATATPVTPLPTATPVTPAPTATAVPTATPVVPGLPSTGAGGAARSTSAAAIVVLTGLLILTLAGYSARRHRRV